MQSDMPSFRPALLFVLACLVGLSGCGTNFDEVAVQSAGAAGRTYLDLLLTDFANALADSFEQQGAPAPEEDVGDTDIDPIPPDDVTPEELTGSSAAGEEIYASNGCTSCHCVDAAGGCALSAPSLVGVASETLDGFLRGDAGHPGGKFNLTNQEIVDLQAYLASLDNG